MSATAFFAALELPRSPAVAVALILLVLAVVYGLLNALVRVGVPRADGEYHGAEAAPEVDAREEPDEGHEPDQPEAAAGAAAPPPPSVLTVEAVRVRGVPLALGDTASQVMRAFRPGEGERLPLIERRPDGMAARVIRTYVVGSRLVVLVLDREDSEEPLRLTAMDIEET